MKRSVLFSVALAGTVLLGSCATASDSTAVSEAPAEAPAEAEAEVTTAQTPEQAPEQAAAYAVFAEDGVAIRGADPVAYFTEGEYTPGSDAFTYDWEGATWQFASAENRDLFAANPEEYAPQYGGFCAWAVSRGTTASIEPTSWEIVDGKLYLNYNAGVQRRWSQDIPGNIAKADQNWPGVLTN